MSETYELVRGYLQAIQKEEDELLEDIQKYAVKNHVPIIKNEVIQLLKVLLTLHKPGSILEIGTAIGYSSILMSQYLDAEGKITTLERSDEMLIQAEKNIQLAHKKSVITILKGEAEEILPTLTEQYDFIFMDAAKGQYITFLPYCLKLLKVGGLLVSDNVLQDGTIAKSKWSIPRRQRTIHGRMRAYLWELNHNEKLRTAILPIADGVTMSYKLKE